MATPPREPLTADTRVKFLRDSAESPYADFDYTPYLPKGNRPGKWYDTGEPPVLCETGIHTTSLYYWHEWAGPRMFVVQEDYLYRFAQENTEGEHKRAVRKARLLYEVPGWTVETVLGTVLDAVELFTPNMVSFYARYRNLTYTQEPTWADNLKRAVGLLRKLLVEKGVEHGVARSALFTESHNGSREQFPERLKPLHSSLCLARDCTIATASEVLYELNRSAQGWLDEYNRFPASRPNHVCTTRLIEALNKEAKRSGTD